MTDTNGTGLPTATIVSNASAKAMVIDALKRIAGSMKVWTVLFGIISTIALKKGLEVDPEIYWTVAGFFGLLVGAQGAADWNKNAALVNAASNLKQQAVAKTFLDGAAVATLKAAEPRLLIKNSETGAIKLLLDNGDEHDITDLLAEASFIQKPGAKELEKGSAMFLVMLIIAAIGTCFAVASCSPLKGTGKAALKDTIDCTVGAAKQTANEYAPAFGQLIAGAVEQGTGKVNWDSIKPAVSNLKSAAAGCALAAAVNAFMHPTLGTGAQPLQVDQQSLIDGFNAIKPQLGAKTFVVDGGKL